LIFIAIEKTEHLRDHAQICFAFQQNDKPYPHFASDEHGYFRRPESFKGIFQRFA